eukprot:1158969-Pelagomonas_calceolata.AAC.6
MYRADNVQGSHSVRRTSTDMENKGCPWRMVAKQGKGPQQMPMLMRRRANMCVCVICEQPTCSPP